MIMVVLNIIFSLIPLLFVYITIIMIILIFKIHASTGVDVLILYDTYESINIVLIIVLPINGKFTMTFVMINSLVTFLIEDKTI